MRYDPDKDPEPKAWLALDETQRIALVTDWHHKAGIDLPRLGAHAAAHVAIESQLALGDPPSIRATLERLMAAGLSRHEAIHAIAGVLLELMSDLMAKRIAPADFSRSYADELAHLQP